MHTVDRHIRKRYTHMRVHTTTSSLIRSTRARPPQNEAPARARALALVDAPAAPSSRRYCQSRCSGPAAHTRRCRMPQPHLEERTGGPDSYCCLGATLSRRHAPLPAAPSRGGSAGWKGASGWMAASGWRGAARRSCSGSAWSRLASWGDYPLVLATLESF